MSDFVHLSPAYFWSCPDCGADNYERAVDPNFNQEQLNNIYQSFQLEPWELKDFVVTPTSVSCVECGRFYQTGVDSEDEMGYDSEDDWDHFYPDVP
jgi:hypothetical protein